MGFYLLKSLRMLTPPTKVPLITPVSTVKSFVQPIKYRHAVLDEAINEPISSTTLSPKNIGTNLPPTKLPLITPSIAVKTVVKPISTLSPKNIGANFPLQNYL